MASDAADSRIIVITGGIGSGKSVVCRALEAMGCPVYDCDSRAKALMDSSDAIKRRIAEEIAAECIDRGDIDRKRLASCVFADAAKLAKLNEITHGAVRDDIRRWADSHAASPMPLIVETAIPRESALDKMAAEVWVVTAPLETRIERVMRRNSLTRSEVEERIASQSDYVPAQGETCNIIVNDGETAVIPQILNLLDTIDL